MDVKDDLDIRHKYRKEIIHDFQVHFFTMGLLSSYPWDSLNNDIASETSDIVEEILQKTCLNPVCLKNPTSLKYRRRFLMELIKRHEMMAPEPLDILYDALSELMCGQEGDVCYKSYFLPTGEVVSLAENVALISQGTTGLVTWEAALYLAEWALENTQVFKNKSVLELGSGIGLTGSVVCRSTGPTKYTFSDYHPAVLQRLQENIANCLTDTEAVNTTVCVEELDWGNVSEEQLQRIQTDNIIAADVVYDPDIIACLVRLLRRFLTSAIQDKPEIYIASTIRNPQTYDSFKKELVKAGLKHVILKDSVTQVFPYSRGSTLEMIQIYV